MGLREIFQKSNFKQQQKENTMTKQPATPLKEILTEREMDVAEQLLQAKSNAEIGQAITPKVTASRVVGILTEIYKKTGVKTREQFIVKFGQRGQ